MCLFVNVDDTASKGLIWKSVTGTKKCTCTCTGHTCMYMHNNYNYMYMYLHVLLIIILRNKNNIAHYRVRVCLFALNMHSIFSSERDGNK